MATPTLIQNGAYAAGGPVLTLNYTIPTLMVAGDLVIACVEVDGGSGSVVTSRGSDNFTLLASVDNGTSIKQEIYAKVATSSEPAQWQWTVVPASEWIVSTVVVRDADISAALAAIEGFGSLQDPATLVVARGASVNTVHDRDLLLYFLTVLANPVTYSVEPGVTALNAGNSFSLFSHADFRAAATAIGPTPERSFGLSAAGVWISSALAITGSRRYSYHTERVKIHDITRDKVTA